MWFKAKSSTRQTANVPEITLPKTPQVYPEGVFVRTSKSSYYIGGPNKRLVFVSDRVLQSWSPQRVIETTEEALSKYRVSSKMIFRTGSLIKDVSDGKLYLISGALKRHITSPDVLTKIGAVESDAILVSNTEVNLHEDGEPLSG